MAKLTKRTIDALQPESKDYFIWDSQIAGFGERVMPSGAKTYQAQYRKGGRTRRVPSRDKKALGKVIKQAKKLHLSLNAISDDATAALRQTDFQYEMQAIVSDNKYSDAGHKFYRYTNQDGVETILIDSVKDLIRAVSVLEIVALKAKDGIRPVPDGRRSDYALSLWIYNIADMWTDQLGRPFTRDATEGGDPLSEAAQFCIAVFAPVDPSISSTRILNEMRKHISQSRKKATGKNRVKNEP